MAGLVEGGYPIVLPRELNRGRRESGVRFNSLSPTTGYGFRQLRRYKTLAGGVGAIRQGRFGTNHIAAKNPGRRPDHVPVRHRVTTLFHAPAVWIRRACTNSDLMRVTN